MKRKMLTRFSALLFCCALVFSCVIPASAKAEEKPFGYTEDGVRMQKAEFDELHQLIFVGRTYGPGEEELEAEQNAQIMGMMCPNCEKGQLKASLVTASNPKQMNVQAACIHHTYGTDLCDVYTRTYEYRCNKCGLLGYTKPGPDLYHIVKCGGYER